MATGLDWRAPLGNRRRIAAVQRIAQQRQLTAFLQRAGKPALHFRIKASLHAQIESGYAAESRMTRPIARAYRRGL